MRIPSGVTDQVIYFVAVDSTDLKTRETGLSSFTVYRSRNGGTATAFTTPTVTEVDSTNMPGVYKLLLDEDMTIDAGDDSQEVCLHITQASMAPVTRVYELYRAKITAGETVTAANGCADADLERVAGATTDVSALATNVAAILVDTGTTLDGRIPAALVSGRMDASVGAMAANVLTATAINADAITAAKVAADVSAEIADAVWDEDATGHQTGGTFGQAIGDPGADTDTIWALANANLDATVSSRASQASVDTVDTNVDSILADTGTDGVVVAAGSKTGYALSAAGVDAVIDEVIEGSTTMRELLRLFASALIGKLAGAATTTVTMRDLADTKDRITATVDADGNRTAITLDAT